ncbi:hypothetical protein BX666DRAFT_1849231 [Dichotomocladium elegans]|nr:hypothetical protein BX666DRAFT_1849231 [Dichotomocladium elegans]
MQFGNTSLQNPKLILRTYQAGDKDDVNALFASTYYSLVAEGVRAKLRAPVTWILWLGGYLFFQTVLPNLLFGHQRENSWPEYFLKMGLTLGWVAVVFIAFFIKTERYELVDRIMEARENDLSDIDGYYLHQKKNDNVASPPTATPASHFWVLVLDGHLTGMVGLVSHNQTLYDKRTPTRTFAEPTPPKTAVLQRLAIENGYHECGLSTLLVDRAMTWANEHGIETVVAYTNEMQRHAQKILVERHGFKIEKMNKGWFGYETKLVCSVEQWMAKHGESSKGLLQTRRVK